MTGCSRQRAGGVGGKHAEVVSDVRRHRGNVLRDGSSCEAQGAGHDGGLSDSRVRGRVRGGCVYGNCGRGGVGSDRGGVGGSTCVHEMEGLTPSWKI